MRNASNPLEWANDLLIILAGIGKVSHFKDYVHHLTNNFMMAIEGLDIIRK